MSSIPQHARPKACLPVLNIRRFLFGSAHIDAPFPQLLSAKNAEDTQSLGGN